MLVFRREFYYTDNKKGHYAGKSLVLSISLATGIKHVAKIAHTIDKCPFPPRTLLASWEYPQRILRILLVSAASKSVTV